MPPVVRLTSLGIKQVPKNVVEASRSFGATPMQLLFKYNYRWHCHYHDRYKPDNPDVALHGGHCRYDCSRRLGEIVLKGITQMKIGLGFEGGIAVVILAIILDRITQGLGKQKKGK